MNFIKPIGSVEIDKSADMEIEVNIRNLVRQDSAALEQPDPDSEVAANDLSALMHRVSVTSTQEIDNLIDKLRSLRGKLQADGNRVRRDITEYAALNQSVIQLTKIVSESMEHVKKLPNAPNSSGSVHSPSIVGAAREI